MPEQQHKGSKWRSRQKNILGVLAAISLLVLLQPLPDRVPAFSRSVYSAEGQLLAAAVSSEQQWCLPLSAPVPENFKRCLVLYEDEYFYLHPGINPVSVIKALNTNIRHKKVKRGASTLTMQLMRMKNRSPDRSMLTKIRESLCALKYDLIHSKENILREWAQTAPFGGNTIGLEAAALRYFGREPQHLSWAEYALLAVMPNNPTGANLNVNREALLKRRNLLLTKLADKGYIAKEDLEIHLAEELPDRLLKIPQHSFHFLQFASKQHSDKYLFHSTLQFDIQQKLNQLLSTEAKFLQLDGIQNIAAVVLDVEKNELVAYTGNISDRTQTYKYVDIVQAPRSYGSLLKPLLYAHCLEQDWFLPKELVADIPTAIGDFRPQNFDKKFRGAVKLDEMLIQSLNVPAVRILNTTGYESFYHLIKRLKLAYLNKGADYYGLSIILGGGECSLWDLARLYKGFARNYAQQPYPFNEVKYLRHHKEKLPKDNVYFSASSMLPLTDALSDLTRPREEKSRDFYSADNKVAWKTGTSHGHKDAWAIGYNAKYTVAVWVGNETGEGRYDLTGISRAAPVMFKIFNMLPDNRWFSRKPVYQNREQISVCRESGKIAGQLCRHKEVKYVERSSMQLGQCSYHRKIQVNEQGQLVTERCNTLNSRIDTVFVLPPYMEYFYKPSNPAYRGMPPPDPECAPAKGGIQIIYPQEGMKIFLPREKQEERNQLIAKAYHQQPDARIYWFIDEVHTCISTAQPSGHQCMTSLTAGKHSITVTDQWGNTERIHFEVLGE
jgi:penicillin-binding protein 1C